MISTSRTSDFQISGSAISSHKNIHSFRGLKKCRKNVAVWKNLNETVKVQIYENRLKYGGSFNMWYSWMRAYDQLGGNASPLAVAIIDRITHDSYRINITSIDAEHDISMREVYGLDKTLRE